MEKVSGQTGSYAEMHPWVYTSQLRNLYLESGASETVKEEVFMYHACCVSVGEPYKLTKKYLSVKIGVLGGVQLLTSLFLLWVDCRLADDIKFLTIPLSNGLHIK